MGQLESRTNWAWSEDFVSSPIYFKLGLFGPNPTTNMLSQPSNE